MNDTVQRKIDLACAWSGIAYIVLLFIGWGPIANMVPMQSPSETPAQVVAFYHANRLRVIGGMIVMMWGSAAFLPFSALIADHVAKFEGKRRRLTYCFVMAAFANAMFTFYPAALWLDIAFRPNTSADIVYFMNDVCWLQFLGNATLSLPMFAVVAIIALFDSSAQPVFPRWVGYFNIWTLIGLLPPMALYFFYTGPFAWNGLIAVDIPFTEFTAWFFIIFYYVRKAALDCGGFNVV